MGLLSFIVASARKLGDRVRDFQTRRGRTFGNFEKRCLSKKWKPIPIEQRRRYDRLGNLYKCRSCGHVHDTLPYMCRGCGKRMMDFAAEEDITKFWEQFPPNVRPEKDFYMCGNCGQRLKTNYRCWLCKRVNRLTPCYGLPNFERVDDFSIRCGKCLRLVSVNRKFHNKMACSKCHNLLIVASYRKDFTTTKPIVVNPADESLSTPAIIKKSQRATAGYHRRKADKINQSKPKTKKAEWPPELKEEW